MKVTTDIDRRWAESFAGAAVDALHAAERDGMASDEMVATTNALLAIYHVLRSIDDKLTPEEPAPIGHVA